MRKVLPIVLLCLLIFAIYQSLPPNLFSKPKAPVAQKTAGTPAPPVLAAPPTPAPPPKEGDIDKATGEHLVKCPECHGSGTVKCSVPNCKEGYVDCPGPCLKIAVGKWEHLDVKGHDPSELWQVFKYKGNGSQWHAWNQNHVGEVIEFRNGVPENIGKCVICGGTAKVPCTTCHKTGHLTCNTCKGTRLVPASVAARAAALAPPKAAQPPASPGLVEPSLGTESTGPFLKPQTTSELIRLKDGRTIQGRIMISNPETVVIKTTDGKMLELPASSVLQTPGA